MINNSPKGLAVIISSPSGVGKSTIAREILRLIKNSRLSISCTTRKARINEINGKDYYFVSKKKFFLLKKKKLFIETAKVYNHYYGTLKSEVFNYLNKKIIILDVDWQGAKSIKKILKKNCISFYLIPPSLIELKKRLLKRHEADPKTGILRFSKAKDDLKKVAEYDYIVINEKIKRCTDIIIKKIAFEQNKIKDNFKTFKKINLLIKS